MQLEEHEKEIKQDADHLWYEGRKYLFDERRERETVEKENAEIKAIEEKEAREAEYIDQFYGNTYQKDLETYPCNNFLFLKIKSE